MVSKILKFGKQKGSSTLLPAHGLGGARATILSFLYSVSPSVRKKFWPSPPPLKLWRAGIQAGGNAGAGFQIIRAIFAQKRFELRSAIATNLNFFQIQRRLVARSPRLRRGSLRKNPFVWRLNQTAGEARRGLVWKAGGGSELRSNSSRKCGISNFSLSAFGGIRSQFFNPALYGQKRLTI